MDRRERSAVSRRKEHGAKTSRGARARRHYRATGADSEGGARGSIRHFFSQAAPLFHTQPPGPHSGGHILFAAASRNDSPRGPNSAKALMNPPSSLELWKQHGESLLVVQPFMDRLIVRGDGCYLVDADGRRVLDLAAGQFCSILGHNHPRFTARLREQLEALVHLGDQYIAPVVLQAARRLASIAPVPRGKVLFLSTGSEANECAMRIAKAVTGRTGMLAFSRGYYGISLATRNLSSISDHPGKVDFLPAPIEQYKLLSPTCNRCPIQKEYPSCDSACLAASLDLVSQHLENVAAVIVESVLSVGGMIFL